MTNIGIRDEIATLRRERTIGAAVDLFYERGYDNTTLEAVAESMGVTKPFIYSNFDSKTELLGEICARAIRSSLAAMDSALAINAAPVEKLRRLSRDFVASVLENQKPIAILTREEKNIAKEDMAGIAGMRREFDRKLTALLEEGRVSGDFRINDAHLAALAIGGLVSWAYVWYRPRGRLTADALADEIAALILNLAGASAASSRRRGEQRTRAAR